MAWLELQVGSEDSGTAPPRLKPVSAGNTPVLWGASAPVAACLCRGPGSCLEQRRLLLGRVLLTALVAWSPTGLGQREAPPVAWLYVPPHNTPDRHLLPSRGRGWNPSSSKALDHGVSEISLGVGTVQGLVNWTPQSTELAAPSGTGESGSIVATPPRHRLPSRLGFFPVFTNVWKSEDAFNTRT